MSRWSRQTETDRFGRAGRVYLSADGQFKISDEGPAPWTVMKKEGGRFRAVGEYSSPVAAKRAVDRGKYT